MSSGLDELGREFALRMADLIEKQVAVRLKAAITDAFKANIQIVFSEEEAAAFLKVSVDTLQAWRKRNLIAYSRYPVSRIRKTGDEEKLSDMITYDLAALLSFRDGYIVESVSPGRYELQPRFTLVGPAVEDIKTAKGRKAA